jgi:undecaprenyl-diphosphatase
VLIGLIEHVWLRGTPRAEVEELFGHLELVAPALGVAGVLILVSGLLEKRSAARDIIESDEVDARRAWLIGAVQGLCLPFRGLSRSGATISAGMLAGVSKARAEAFSFALAVIITPPAVGREVLRLMRAQQASGTGLAQAVVPGLLGAACAFVAGLIALRWLSSWLEKGRWYLFGIYCLVAASVVTVLHHGGF